MITIGKLNSKVCKYIFWGVLFLCLLSETGYTTL